MHRALGLGVHVDGSREQMPASSSRRARMQLSASPARCAAAFCVQVSRTMNMHCAAMMHRHAFLLLSRAMLCFFLRKSRTVPSESRRNA